MPQLRHGHVAKVADDARGVYRATDAALWKGQSRHLQETERCIGMSTASLTTAIHAARATGWKEEKGIGILHSFGTWSCDHDLDSASKVWRVGGGLALCLVVGDGVTVLSPHVTHKLRGLSRHCLPLSL